MEIEKMFTVSPLRMEDEKSAKVVEAIINQPQFVSRVNAVVAEYVHKFLLPQILYGTEIDPNEVEKFMQASIAKQEDK